VYKYTNPLLSLITTHSTTPSTPLEQTSTALLQTYDLTTKQPNHPLHYHRMHFTTPFLVLLSALAITVAASKDGVPPNNCGAPFCKRAAAMESIKAKMLAKQEVEASATAAPTVATADAETE
jgi:hypothetical protein